MKTTRLFLLSILSALLLTFAWFPHGFIPLLFIGFVPLLLIQHDAFQNPKKFGSLRLFGYSYLTFLIWNVLTTFWVTNASLGGGIMAITCNALLMSLVFLFFHKTKKRLGKNWGYLVFICFWLTWEFFHLRWDLSWPWLTLGNAFADTPVLIQWYEYTGVFGGSLWVLLANVLVFEMILNYKTGISKFKKIALVLLIIVPVTLSYLITLIYKGRASAEGKALKVVVVQPNIDPYNEKFTGSYEDQLQKMLHLASQKTDSSTDYLLFPETALTEDIWEEQLFQSGSIKMIREFLKRYPKLKIITGASTQKAYRQGEEVSATARKYANADEYFDSYNTALQLDNSGKIQIYHKSKLVPGVEKMPFPFIFKHLGQFAIDLGGTAGSLGTQDERSVFVSPDNKIGVAPVVCYESIYGEYVTEYVTNGAQFIAIITNDGWWGDTPGYKQHLKYGALRAIENRRWVARSANTGISCFINPMGEILQPSTWWTPDAISGTINVNNDLTFYTRFGDYIARIAMYASLLLIIYALLIRFKIVNKS